MCRLKKQRKRRISATPFNRFSSSLHQKDRTVFGHLFLVTDEPENVGKCKNLQKFQFFKPEYFFKKHSQRQISLAVMGYKRNRMGSGFGSVTANDHRL